MTRVRRGGRLVCSLSACLPLPPHGGADAQVVVLGEECVRAKPFPDPYQEGGRAWRLGRPQPVSRLSWMCGTCCRLQRGGHSSCSVPLRLGQPLPSHWFACTGMRHLGLTPETTLVVEDSPTGVQVSVLDEAPGKCGACAGTLAIGATRPGF